MFDPTKNKYHELYWDMASRSAKESIATRHQVGAVVVTKAGMISVGWNGMPPGMPNECESTKVFDEEINDWRPKTNPEVIHAERNALDKMHREGVSTIGAIVFITRAPCIECAKALQNLGLKAVYYDVNHDDMRGVDLLNKRGILCISKEEHENFITREKLRNPSN